MADLILFAIIILFAYYGAKKGFVKSLLGLLSTLISTILTFLIYRPVSQLIYYTFIGDAVKEFVRGLLIENVAAEGATATMEASVEAGAILITSVISFVIVIIISKFIVSAVIQVVNLASSFPIIRQTNGLFGFLIGAFGGFLVSYIIIGVIAALNYDGTISLMQEMLSNSYFAVKLYDNNILANLLSGIF